jgi:deoxyribonuclease-4
MWAMPAAKPDLDNAFKEKAAELDIETYVHAPFLINLGSPTEATYLNSLASTAYSLQRGVDIGALGVVIHTGSAVETTHVERAWKQIHEGMMPILDALSDDSPFLLLEPTAGQGQSLVKKLDDLENYLKALEYHPKVGICLDTCHVFAAGHDIAVKGGMAKTLDLLVEIAGVERFKLGVDPFTELLAHPAAAGVPLVLETPGMEEKHTIEVALLKKLRDKK